MEPMDIQDRITTFWETVAPIYEAPENENVAAPGTEQYAAWTEAIRSVLPEAAVDVLDVGTGTGFVARIAADLGHTVTATDVSGAMLDTAASRATRSEPITFAHGDAVAPDFPPARFDVVINRSLLWTLREPARALRNWHTLLRPGGRVVAIYGLAPATRDSTPTAAPDEAGRADLFARHYTEQVQAALPAIHLHDHEPLRRSAVEAGFSDVRVVRLTTVTGWETSPGSDQPYALVCFRHEPA